MDIIVYPGKLQGDLTAIPSKSQAHRLLICAAFADRHTRIICKSTNKDIEATAQCLNALGATIQRTNEGYEVDPISTIADKPILNCNESGSTLRFMLPIVGAMGVNATFKLAGRLPQRPLSPLWEEMERMGCRLELTDSNTLQCTGKLHSGEYHIAGNVSSQFITGLLYAAALMEGTSVIHVEGKIESKPYIDMTCDALMQFGVHARPNSPVHGIQKFNSPGELTVEGDWSNSAFFLAANALGSNIHINGLNNESKQGDRACKVLFEDLKERILIDGTDIPDLIPILSVVASAKSGAEFINIGRLRLKESDRINTVGQMLNALGIPTTQGTDSLIVESGSFNSCTVDAANDHRIAMSAAIAATVSTGPVTILGADCIEKSYPDFWKEFEKLGGKYEQHIR